MVSYSKHMQQFLRHIFRMRFVKQIREHAISHMKYPSLGWDIISLWTSICSRPNNSLLPFSMSSKWDLGHFIYEIKFINSIWFKIIQIKNSSLYYLFIFDSQKWPSWQCQRYVTITYSFLVLINMKNNFIEW